MELLNKLENDLEQFQQEHIDKSLQGYRVYRKKSLKNFGNIHCK